MHNNLNTFLKIALISIIPTLLIWLPFFFRIGSFWGIPLPKDGMAVVAANYDGPLYIAVAKTLYDKTAISSFPFDLPTEYYAAHFPLYPILIKVFAGVFGFPYSMLFVTALSSIVAMYFFYLLFKQLVGSDKALLATIIFSIFPARWLIVRSVGSPEPLFLGAIIASVYYFRNNRYLLAGIWGAIAQFTKSPGILLFIAYCFTIGFPLFRKMATSNKRENIIVELRKYWGIILIPISLLITFALFKVQMNDFWAYFRSGDNIHLFFPPFQIFNFSSPWVGTFWLEEIIFVYLFGILGLIKLIKSGSVHMAWVVGVFFASLLFVSHRDLIRYSLPIVPFLLAAYAKDLVKKDFKVVIAILIIPIYLFSLAFISQNVMPISNWGPLL